MTVTVCEPVPNIFGVGLVSTELLSAIEMLVSDPNGTSHQKVRHQRVKHRPIVASQDTQQAQLSMLQCVVVVPQKTSLHSVYQITHATLNSLYCLCILKQNSEGNKHEFLKDIANRPMTRGEFIRSIAVLSIGAFGIGNAIATILDHRTSKTTSIPHHSRGSAFGTRKFGV